MNEIEVKPTSDDSELSQNQLILNLVNKLERSYQEQIELLKDQQTSSDQEESISLREVEEHFQNLEQDMEDHEEQTESDDSDSVSKGGTTRRIECPICESQIGVQGFSSHMSETHDEPSVEEFFKYGDVYECTYCDYNTQSYEKLRHHWNYRKGHPSLTDIYLKHHEISDAEIEEDKSSRYEKAKCPICNQTYHSNSLGKHVSSNHENGLISNYFRNDEKGVYECPECDYRHKNWKTFCVHFGNKHEGGITVYWAEKYDSDSEEEDLAEYEKRDIPSAKSVDVDERKELIREYLKRNKGPQSTRDIYTGIFSGPFNNKKRAMLYNDLNVMDDVRVNKNRSPNGYQLKSETQPDLEQNWIEQASSKLGKRNWNVLLNSIFNQSGDREPLINKDTEKDEFGFYRFSGKFGSTDEFSAEEMWEELLTSEKVQKALSDSFEDNDLTFKVKNLGSSNSMKDKILEVSKD